MGLTLATVRVRKDRTSSKAIEHEFIVDSGAVYTVIPAKVLVDLRVEQIGEKVFTLANGEKITRKIGEAYFEVNDNGGTSKVIFGQAGDQSLLGVLAMEAMDLGLDPVRRELIPLPMLMA